MGVYNTVYAMRRERVHKNGRSMSFGDRLLCGTVAGMAGAIVGNPSEVVLVRMTSDNRLPIEKRRNYKNALQALFRITKEEGILAWFKGLNSTILRCVVQNAFQLGSYSQIKMVLLESGMKDDLFIVPGISSFGAGFIASFMSLPFDIVKTRLQTMKPGQYKNTIDCASKLLSKEGIRGFWKGFVPYYLRVGPHTVVTFIVLEQLNHLYLKYLTNPNKQLEFKKLFLLY
uniref:Oxoglutarate/malate carrier protein n=1 Tax=Opalina sp. OP10 TaxID=2666322 RepID=A0A649UZ64_9STRA|nr:oxoglutarate/malate carrier protein [Opalina sp. OP10]